MNTLLLLSPLFIFGREKTILEPIEMDSKMDALSADLNEEAYISPSKRQLIDEEINLTEDRRGIVVLEPGSFNLRFGFAEQEDLHPATMVQCIAYRRTSNQSQTTPENILPHTNQLSQGITGSGIGLKISSATDSMEIDGKPSNVLENNNEHELNGIKVYEAEVKAMEESYEFVTKELDRLNKNSSVRYLNQDNSHEILPEDKSTPKEWVDLTSEPSYLVGHQALYLDDDDPYDVYFPFKNGRFNYECNVMTSYSHNHYKITRTQVLNSLYLIWNHVVRERLDIKSTEVSKFDVILVIPDSFDPAEVQDMMDILLNEIGFGHILLQKSSVCAALGAGKVNCTVVDIGFSRTTISCIDELNIIEGSHIQLSKGGLDVSKFLRDLLEKSRTKNFYSYLGSKIDTSIQDLIIFEEMKESSCHMNTELVKPKMYEFLVHHRNSNAHLYRLDVGMPQFFAPFILINPRLDKYLLTSSNYSSASSNNSLHDAKNLHAGNKNAQSSNPSHIFVYRPEDHFGSEFYRPEKAPLIKKSAAVKPTSSSASNTPATTNTTVVKTENTANGITDATRPTTAAVPQEDVNNMDPEGMEALRGQTLEDLMESFKITNLSEIYRNFPENISSELSLAQAIITAISTCTTNPTTGVSNPRAQHRLLSNIVLVGGSSQFSNLNEVIEAELIELAPGFSQFIQAVLPPAGATGLDCTWRGAALLVSQTPRDFWLDKIAWRTSGLLALREKLLFSWDNPHNLKLR